jgi:hypothetical protein
MEYVYVLECADGSLYTGWTTHLEKRLRDHNRGRGARYTRGRGPVTLVYFEIFSHRQEALKREIAIKKMSRARKLSLIKPGPGKALHEKRVYDLLADLEAPYEVVAHEPIFTANREVAAFEGKEFLDIKNLFLKGDKGKSHYLLVMPYDKTLDLKALGQKIGQRRLSFASEDRLEKFLEAGAGGVSIFNLLSPGAREVVLVLDAEILAARRVGFHPNNPERTVILEAADFQRVIDRMNNPRIMIEG